MLKTLNISVYFVLHTITVDYIEYHKCLYFASSPINVLARKTEEVARILLRGCGGGCGLSSMQINSNLPNIPPPPPTTRPRPRRFANGVLLRQRTLSSEPPGRGVDSICGDMKVRLKPEWRASRRNSGISSLTTR